jgi:heterotetrameric sarcosine oxidase alpha subunit
LTQKNRIAGGLINRTKPLNFTFNGKTYGAYEGDTLASALIANDCRLIGRSFKYHRPRGIFSAGSEEPNALLTVNRGNYQEPNTRATVTEVFDGLTARSQNHVGSLKFDALAVNDLLARFLSAGFYYKTFMWPKSFWEKIYEPAIRASAGLGSLSGAPDPDSYDKGFLHCDLLIVGAGPAGLSAALAASRTGARVILADEDYRVGGRLNAETHHVDGKQGSVWATEALKRLSADDNVRVMTRTTIYGVYDGGTYGALERKTDHLSGTNDVPRQILWRIYASRTILAAGATERPIAFGNNDRPGIMLAGAVRAYANRWAATPGSRVALFTNNNDGWRTAEDLSRVGIEISAVVDTRNIQPVANIPGASIVMGGSVVGTKGRRGLKSILLSNGQQIKADCLAVSGGWNPNVHLTCHHRGRPQWSDDIAAFVPGGILPDGMTVAGAANGKLTLGAALADGWRAAVNSIAEGYRAPNPQDMPIGEDEKFDIVPFWRVKESRPRAWLDLQNDVTVKDVVLAAQEGYRSVEHMKRYTTLGMATDQGKTANVNALAIQAELLGKSIAEVGTTIFRPPYTPIAIAAFAGHARGRHFRPTRMPPSHQWASENDAVFAEAGLWLRAQYFRRDNETQWRQSVDREVTQTRSSVGVCDVTTLGKIDIQGRDVIEFANRVYCNNFSNLQVGKVRYGLMLREDGFVMDDGTLARLRANQFVMTTTTLNAVSVFRHLEFCRQCLWPELDVHLISVTEQWSQYAIAGPNSRQLLEQLIDPEHDISNASFPYMACKQISICGGTPARLFRISFSGEMAFEIAVPARYGDALFRKLMSSGQALGVVAYGTDALNVMRIEKGHVAGSELNGQTTAGDLGLGALVSKKKDCVGGVLSEREEMNRADRMVLMGFQPIDPEDTINSGAHFISGGKQATMENDDGWMSSTAYSPTLGHYIGLGFIAGGRERIGETVQAFDAVNANTTEVEIVSPHFVDPKGQRLRA